MPLTLLIKVFRFIIMESQKDAPETGWIALFADKRMETSAVYGSKK